MNDDRRFSIVSISIDLQYLIRNTELRNNLDIYIGVLEESTRQILADNKLCKLLYYFVNGEAEAS